MENIDKFMLQLGDRASTVAQPLAELILADVEESLLNKGVDTAKCPALIRRIAMIQVNQIGSEGITSESYSGISQSLMTNLPADVLAEIHELRAVRF